MVGCGGGWLRAGAPVAKHDQKVINVDYAVDVDITDTGGRTIIATSTFAEPSAAAFIATGLRDSHTPRANTTRATGSCVLIVTDTVAIRVSPFIGVVWKGIFPILEIIVIKIAISIIRTQCTGVV